MNERRTLEQESLRRNVPMPAEAWQRLLEDADSTVVETDRTQAALVVQDGQLRFYFAYPSVEALKATFHPMWDLLRPELERYPQETVRADIVSMPNRRWAQELLEEADFVLSGEWVELERHDVADAVPPEFPDGLQMRKMTAEDHERVRDIAREAIEALGTFASASRVLALDLDAVGWGGVLERDGEVVAFAINDAVQGPAGRVLAHGASPAQPDHRELAALVLAAATYQLASQGARVARVRASFEERDAIAAAREAGYDPGTRGIEFQRPNDEDEVARRREQRHVEGMKVRFGQWR